METLVGVVRRRLRRGLASSPMKRCGSVTSSSRFDWKWPDWFPPAVEIPHPFPNAKPVPEPALADVTADGQPANTTGDTQVDAYLRDEMRRWQEDFGFDESVLVEIIGRSLHAFRPFLLFRGGHDAIQEVCRDAHDEADRSRRRLNRGGEFGQAGREETVQRGTYLFNAIEAAAADWLQDKTLENVDPEVPAGGWSRPATNALRIAGKRRQFRGTHDRFRTARLACQRECPFGDRPLGMGR